MALEDAYWYSSERWYVYVLTDPFLNFHLSHILRMYDICMPMYELIPFSTSVFQRMYDQKSCCARYLLL